MADDQHQRFVLLNRLVSRSTSHAPQEFKPPIVGAAELLALIDARHKRHWAIEFLGLHETIEDFRNGDDARIKRGRGDHLDFIWLRDVAFFEQDDWQYGVLLFEYIDQSKRSFSVVDTVKLTGREISGNTSERGSRSAHVVVRLPIKQYDDGSYRCVIEVNHSVTRSNIESFLCRQLRRQASLDELTFTGKRADRQGRVKENTYRYTPRLELHADIGRKIDFGISGGRELAYMTFTKRQERRSIGKKTELHHEDVIADVQLRVSAKQGPEDPKERATWLAQVRAYFESNGYDSHMTYRNLGGSILSGAVHHALAGATDLVMCQKELISLSATPKDWYTGIDEAVVEQMISFTDADQLWERSK